MPVQQPFARCCLDSCAGCRLAHADQFNILILPEFGWYTHVRLHRKSINCDALGRLSVLYSVAPPRGEVRSVIYHASCMYTSTTFSVNREESNNKSGRGMNVNLDAFTYITGIAGLLGLVLQFKDSFPEHRDLRKNVVLLVIGVFVGSLVTTFKGVKIDIGPSITGYQGLIGVVVAVLVFVSVVAAFTKDGTRRAELFTFTAAGTGVLLLLLLGGAAASSKSTDERTSLEELIYLSNYEVEHRSYERALMFLDEAKTRLAENDDRRKDLDNRESQIKKMQVSPQ